jgi:glycerophosphoryl diester phosphodiesterase
VDRRRHPFLDAPVPVAIAHRGGAEEAAENTIEAFGAAATMG